MYRRFDPMLRDWEEDPAVRAVLVRGAGERAFCAGGDVRAVYEAGRGICRRPRDLTSVFFREEYELIRRIHRYPKPYLAIIDGITMGGGAGVSVNGAYRIATEKTLLAMPETGIGLFPDVGATRFLNLCPGHIGRYLGLTGARLGPADALYCGFATHFVPRERDAGPGRGACRSDLARRRRARADRRGAGRVPQRSRRAAARCAPRRDRPVFRRRHGRGASSTRWPARRSPAVRDGEWAAETRAGLLTKSPTSLKVTLRQLIVGRGYELEQALALEYRLTQHFMAGHDFYEGVRAIAGRQGPEPAMAAGDARPR